MTAKTEKEDSFHVGRHCQEPSCNRLDFLPVKCDGCSQTYCNDHFRYDQHKCSSGRSQNNQVPVCPLCNAPIPVKRGELPDIRVGQHIDADCQSETALHKRKIYTNRCSAKGCKKKEMIRVECTKCHKSFCISHRFPDDHQCAGPESSVSRAGAAALARFASSPKGEGSRVPEKHSRPTVQAQMTEDEALARALQLSLSSSDEGPSNAKQRLTAPSNQEEEDLELAQAMAASEAEFHTQSQNKQKSCVMA